MENLITLTTKIQYKNFEPGEFTEERKRSYNETIALIENFPWESQRDKLLVSLTNPSISMEDANNNYLKFALYYNGKFVLHYFNRHNLFTKSFIDYKDAYPYIKNFFTAIIFDLNEFRKENTLGQHNLIHFVSQDFHYTVTSKRIRSYLLSKSGINFGLAILFTIMLLSKGVNNINFAGIAAILLVLFIYGGGLNLVLFFNYYLFAKNKILVMSKGNDIFYFGNENSPAEYNKQQISLVTIHATKSNYKNPIAGFAFVEITFKDGDSIIIPDLLIEAPALCNKLFSYPMADKNGFPFITKKYLR